MEVRAFPCNSPSAPQPTRGLDIEADSIAAAEVSVNGSISVGATGIAPLAPGIAAEGEVTDPEALGEALKELFAEHKLPKSVRVGIANQRVVVRTLRMPVIGDAGELETAIRFQAQDHIPMSLEDAVLDWQVLEADAELRRSGQTDVVVAAARRETVQSLTEALQSRRPEAGRHRRLRLRDDPRPRR